MKRYLLATGIFLLLIIGSIGAINYFVDPLLLFNYKDAGSEKLSRIDQFENMRLYKPLHVNRIKPAAIIIGTSRSGNIRPRHPSWEGLSTYNFSMPGMTIFELSRSVQHAQANRPLERLMIGLDYNTIISSQVTYRAGFEPARMARDATDFHSSAMLGQNLRDLQTTIFSSEVLSTSLQAWSKQGPNIRKYHTDGSWEALSNRLTGRGGYIYVARNTLSTRKNIDLHPKENLATLYQLLDFCYRNNIETKLFFTPMHSFFLDLWFRIASEKLWRSVYQQVVTMNSELAEQYDQTAYSIHGFGNERQVVSEPIYLARHIEQAWFNDGLHYRAKLADRIMDALWRPDADFGQKLTPGTLNEYLDRVASLRAAFVQANPQLVEDMYQQIGGEL